jgi:hypothetical protein
LSCFSDKEDLEGEIIFLPMSNLAIESPNHRILWEEAQRQLKTAKDCQTNLHYYHLSALVLAYFCLESYLDFMIKILRLGELRLHEDNLISDKYRGIDEKLLLILEKMKFSFDQRKKHYRSIKRLQKFRDYIVGSRPDHYLPIIGDKEGFPVNSKKIYLDRELAHRNVHNITNDVKSVINILHQVVRHRRPDLNLSEEALDEIHTWQNGPFEKT